MITALVARKGGVGKTTTAVNLAAALASLQQRVLLVDLDAQASASRSLGVPRSNLAPSAADVLAKGFPIAQAIRTTSVPRLDLITASADLSGIDLALAAMRAKETRLRTTLAGVRRLYDYIFLDCAAGYSLLTENALVAADNFLVPVVPQFLAVEGVQNLLAAVDRLRANTGARVAPLGLLLSMVDYRLKLTREIVDLLRIEFARLVFGIEMRVNVRLAEAPGYGRTIFQHDAGATGARLFELLAEEFQLRAAPEHALAAV